MARAKYSAMRERSVGMGVMGYHSFLQKKGIGFRKRDGQGLEPAHVPAHQRAQGERGVDAARKGARPLPRRRRRGRDGALQLQDGDRADRLDQHHLRRHQRLHRADSRRTSTRTRRCRAASSVKNPYLQRLLAAKSKDSTAHLELDPRARRLGPAPRFPQPRGKGRSTRPASRSTSAGCSNSPQTAPPISTRRSR